ncbi:pentapeptide repeat-containing protein [Synechococcus sp. CBW1006]|nr:pentapeptide repeat-containing protein [Synechococcus sp. CBW1006]
MPISKRNNKSTDIVTSPSRLASLSFYSTTPEQQKPPGNVHEGAFDARGADWRNLTLGEIDLSKARLCRVDLRGVDLHGCRLEGTDLRLARYDSHTIWPNGFDFRSCGAIGPQAKLNGAFLNSADLSEMDLEEASLMGAYLSGADLSGACLRGARLAGADLRHARLRGALCEETRFLNCQLDYVDFRCADLNNVELSTAGCIRGADFSDAIYPDALRTSLLGRAFQELDCWNPLTRRTTRESLLG